MQEAIIAVGPVYETAKRAINEISGYEDGYGTVSLTIEASNKEEVLKNFLGLGDGLRVNKFLFTPSRFGIASPVPQIDVSSGIVHITPQPAGEVEIRLRSPASSRAIVLQGHAYGMGLPGVPADQKRVRFSAGFIEMLWGPGGQSGFSAPLDGGGRHSLATIEDYVSLNEWLTAGSIDLQVWTKGQRIFGGTLNCEDSSPGLDWPKLSPALRLLRLIAGNQNPEILTQRSKT